MRSVFEQEHSRGAQRVVNYVGAVGIGALASLDGRLLLSSARSAEQDELWHLARRVARASSATEPGPLVRILSLGAPGPCTYFARVGAACVLFVVVQEPMTPAAVMGRLSRVIAVFDRVMGRPWEAPGGGSGGTPSAAGDFALLSRRPVERYRPG
jgi:hypothetical protein